MTYALYPQVAVKFLRGEAREEELGPARKESAPAVVERRLDGGRLLLFTSTIDRDWNDLAIHAASPSIVWTASTMSPGRANRGATPAKVALELIERQGIFRHRERARRAGRKTLPAAGDAARRPQHDLLEERLPFRIVAPGTAERAAFEKDGCPDSGAVVDGVFFDIENQAFAQGVVLPGGSGLGSGGKS